MIVTLPQVSDPVAVPLAATVVFAGHSSVAFPGHVMLGRVVSVIEMVEEHVASAPLPSQTVSVTSQFTEQPGAEPAYGLGGAPSPRTSCNRRFRRTRALEPNAALLSGDRSFESPLELAVHHGPRNT